MYGIKQAARLAFDNIIKPLALHRYLPVDYSPGLWKYNTCSTLFILCDENFVIKVNSM